MTSLLTNTAAMTALTTLKGINQQLDATSNRVSTGQKVSAASDNAAYWSIATTVRTDNASLSAVKDSLGLGSSAVDTAYNGLNSVLSDLQNMRAKLQTALQPGVDRAKVQVEIAAIQNKMKSTADSSISSGQNWLSVNSASTNTAYQATQNVVAGFSRDASGTINFSKVSIDVNSIKLYDVNATNITTDATEAKVVGSTALTGTSAFTNGTIDFTATSGTPAKPKQVNLSVVLGDGTSASITLDKTTLASSAKDLSKVTSDELLSAINNQLGASKLGGKVVAGLDTSGRLTFQTTSTGSASQLTVLNGTPPLSNSDLKSASAIADNLSAFTSGDVTFNIGGANYAVAFGDVGATGSGDRAKFLNAINTKIAASGVTASYDSSNKLLFTKTEGSAIGAITATATGNGSAADPGLIETAPPAYVAADIGFGTVPGTAAQAAKVTAATAYANADLSGNPTLLSPNTYTAANVNLTSPNTLSIVVNDGNGNKTIALDNSKYTATAGVDATTPGQTAVTGADLAKALNKELQAQSSNARVEFDSVANKFKVYNPSGSAVTISGADITKLGFTATSTATSTAAKSFTINDGSGAKTITLAASDYDALTTKTSTSSRSVTGSDMASIINSKLAAAGVKASVSYDATSQKLAFASTATGGGASLTLGGSDLAALGVTQTGLANLSKAGSAALNGFSGYGTNSGTTTGQGILDSSIGAYSTAAGSGSYSIANIDISKLVGTSGDTDLSAIITAVDKAIAKVTDAGTKLGASKTQIDGQKSFVDTLMKANDRTIGTLVDADIEEESTKLKALQTQQQLAVQALSIANSSSQNILSLFR